MSYVPKMYESINTHAGFYEPSAIHTTNNAEVNFYERTLYERVASNLIFTTPETWDDDYLKYVLMSIGYIAVVKTDKYGVIPQWCTLQGIGIYFQPTKINVNNNLVTVNGAEIGKDCALIKFTPDYFGIWDTIHHYAEKLANASTSVDMNLYNSRLAYFFGAKNKANAEAVKKLVDGINQGNPMMVFNQKLMGAEAPGETPWFEYSRDVKASYIATDLLNNMQTIMDDFDSEIGLPNANTQKRERLITDEVNANNAETMARIYTWMDCMKPGIAMANKLFPGLNLSVRLRWEGLTGAENNTYWTS